MAPLKAPAAAGLDLSRPGPAAPRVYNSQRSRRNGHVLLFGPISRWKGFERLVFHCAVLVFPSFQGHPEGTGSLTFSLSLL